MTREGLRGNAIVVPMVGNEVGIFLSCLVRGFGGWGMAFHIKVRE